MNEKRQVQQELFEEFVGSDKKKQLKRLFSHGQKRTISLLFEHLIFMLIGFIITAAACYLVGVEKGKSLVPKLSYTAELTQKKADFLNAAQSQKTPQSQEQILELKAVQQKAAEKMKMEKLSPESKVYKASAKSQVPIYSVQVACYLKKQEAEKELQQLKSKDYNAFIRQSERYYILCVDGFKDKKSAYAQCKKMRKIYPDCFVRIK